MAGTGMLGWLCTFFLSVRLSTFCAISSVPRKKCYERKWDCSLKPEEVKANSKVWQAFTWWISEGVRVLQSTKFTVFEFSLFFSPFPLLAKVRFTLSVQIIFGNGVTAACFHSPHFLMKRRKTAEHLLDMAGYVTFSSALNKTNDMVSAWFFFIIIILFNLFFPSQYLQRWRDNL